LAPTRRHRASADRRSTALVVASRSARRPMTRAPRASTIHTCALRAQSCRAPDAPRPATAARAQLDRAGDGG
jgi:hypothetical protein